MFDGANDDEALYPAAPLASYLRASSGGDPRRIALLRWRLAGEALRQAARSLRISGTPEAILGTSAAIFERLHTWAQVRAERTATNAQRLHLTLPDGFAPVMCAYLGGALEVLLATTGRLVSADQPRCGADGAPCCVLDVRWSAS